MHHRTIVQSALYSFLPSSSASAVATGDSRAAVRVRRRGGAGAARGSRAVDEFSLLREHTSVRSTGFGPAPGAGTPAVSDARAREGPSTAPGYEPWGVDTCGGPS